MKEIKQVNITDVNNRFYECFVIYENAISMSYRYIPKNVKEWIKGKYDHSVSEEREYANGEYYFIETDIFRN